MPEYKDRYVEVLISRVLEEHFEYWKLYTSSSGYLARFVGGSIYLNSAPGERESNTFAGKGP